MGLSIDLADDSNFAAARIKVVGVGGAGGNAIRSMIDAQVSDVEFVVANTDVQALAAHPAEVKIQLGRNLTRGLGAGATPEVGKKAALEDIQLIQEQLQGADMVFVTAGMGGGTGTGAAPVIAQVARDLGALTVGVVTKPFGFEGRRRGKQAHMGLDELAQHVDSLIVIPNDKLLTLEDGANLAFTEAFRKADEVLVNAVQSISDLIQQNGVVNVDFADVKAVMNNMGRALMGVGYGRGDRRAMDAANAAINSPLLDNMKVEGATGILLNFMGGPDMKLSEVHEAAAMIEDAAHEDANIIFGVVINPEMRDLIKVTVIATGFNREAEEQREKSAVAARPIAPGYHVQQLRPQPGAYNASAGHTPLNGRGMVNMPPPQPRERTSTSPNQPSAVGGRPSNPPGGRDPQGRQPRAGLSMSEEEWDIPAFLRTRNNDE
ncbi:MAG: cell division protein FtsZ [Myxococcales bacterium]|nr:cell division protein FtsZ [Myxococcales bacterium]